MMKAKVFKSSGQPTIQHAIDTKWKRMCSLFVFGSHQMLDDDPRAKQFNAAIIRWLVESLQPFHTITTKGIPISLSPAN